MRSNRLALAAVLAGSTLLGLTSAGVTSVGVVGASTSLAASDVHHQDRADGHHGHGGL